MGGWGDHRGGLGIEHLTVLIDLAFKWIDIFNYLNISKGVQGTVSVSIWVTLFSYASSSTLNPESKRFLK